MPSITRLIRNASPLNWFGRSASDSTSDGARGSASLVCRNLVRAFGAGAGKTLAVNDVSLELRPGELNILMGPSGSGKSTLLAVLSGLLRPDGGSVRAHGQDIWRMSDDEMERFRLKHCSYIFQGYNLFPALTAREQLEIVLRWGEGCTGPEARKRAEHVLGKLGLANRAHLRPSQLSGGEKQRVAIGRALVKNPSFVFADEPTAALDWENGQHVIELLNESARDRGAMVLVVTHDHRLTPFADRVFTMDDGKLSVTSKAEHASPPSHAPHTKPTPKTRFQPTFPELVNA